MGKKKDLDFKKIKIKVGQKKPSNNVTKFTLKRKKIVLPTQERRVTDAQISSVDYTSRDGRYLREILVQMTGTILPFVNKKTDLAHSRLPDTMQPLSSKWRTPWDSIVLECLDSIGHGELFMFTIVRNAVIHADSAVCASCVLFLKQMMHLCGETRFGWAAFDATVRALQWLVQSKDEKKRLMSVDLLLSLANDCPLMFWSPIRPMSARIAANAAYKCVQSFSKSPTSNTLMLTTAAVVVGRVLDGRRAYLTANITSDEAVDDELLCERTIEDVLPLDSVSLDNYLIALANAVLPIAMSILDSGYDNEDELKSLVDVVRILNRCCMRVGPSQQWRTFAERLAEDFPKEYEAKQKKSNLIVPAVPDLVNSNKIAGLTNKERKALKKKIHLEAMVNESIERSVSSADIKTIRCLFDEVNFHSVSLIYQCIVSCKMSGITAFQWSSKFHQFMADRSWHQNDVIHQWLMLAKQLLTLSPDNVYMSSPDILPVLDVFVSFASDRLLQAHELSRVRPLALCVYVLLCLHRWGSSSQNTMPSLPIVDDQMWSIAVLIATDTSSTDVTALRAIYLLLQARYPGTAELFKSADIGDRRILRNRLCWLRRTLAQNQLHTLNEVPCDFFTCDYPPRMKNDIDKTIGFIASSVDDVFCE